MKIFNPLFLIVLTALAYPFGVSAHAFDLTYTDAYILKDTDDSPISNNIIRTYTRISWAQSAYLLEKSNTSSNINILKSTLNDPSSLLDPASIGITSENIDTLLTKVYQPYVNYLKEKLLFYNQEKTCVYEFVSIPKLSGEEILFDKGIQINSRYICPDPITKIQIINNLFSDEFKMQNNIINVYIGSATTLKGALLTSSNRDLDIDLTKSSPSYSPAKTASNKTDPKILTRILSGFTSNLKTSFPLAMVIVFLVGLLHTLEAGHSKLVLASLLINKRTDLRQGVFYSAIFTLTHLSDILILGLILLITNSFVDIFSKLSYLQAFSLYSLFFISIYLFFQNLAHLLQHRYQHTHSHTHTNSLAISSQSSIKSKLLLGFITGLSPCLMGWSIFMVVLSTKNFFALFPVILSFGLGIFVALVIISALVLRFTPRFLDRYHLISDLSPLLSSILLLGFSVFLLTTS